MKRSMKSRTNREPLPDGDEPDDIYFASRERSIDRKTRQFCAQVQRSLTFLLESECSDDCLHGLYVESVSPHPNASRLLVALRPWNHDCAYDLKTVLVRLSEVKGYWRSEVGSAINRKKTPDLVFQILPGGLGHET
jgi:ribosome-binding factor A